MGAFATATEVAEFSGINVPSDLARLQAHLEYASALIRQHMGMTLHAVTNDVVTLEPTTRGTLVLPEWPVTAVSQVLVEGVPLAGTDYTFTRSGLLHRWHTFPTLLKPWDDGATVTYSHGFAESDREFTVIKTICMDAALRAFTLNEGSSATALGPTVMESAGFAPTVFLTEGERWTLSNLESVGVG